MTNDSIKGYSEQGSTPLIKGLWILILIFSLCDIVVSIVTAVINNTREGGYRGLSFATVWSMLLVLTIGWYGTKVSFSFDVLDTISISAM